MKKIVNAKINKLYIDNKEVFVFDFDGVLVDSVELKSNAFFKFYLKYGEYC